MRNHPPAAFVFAIALIAAVLLGLPLPGTATNARAQAPEGPDTTSATTNDSTGIVTAVAPLRTITVDSRRGPFTYCLGPDLHITGPDNHALKIVEVTPGDKVTVYYYLRDGQQTVARIVVLRHGKPAAK